MSIKKYTNGSWTPASYRKYGTETDTITTLPVTIIGDGTPISSYTIKGNMEQNGTPTPSSPIYPSECGERTENLVESVEQGTWSTNGFVKIDADTRCRIGNTIGVVAEQSYTIHCETTGSTQGLVNVQYKNDSGTSIGESGWKNFGTSGDYTVTIPSGTTKINIILTLSPGNLNCSPLDFSNIMLNSGSTPLPYEPYGYKLPITLGSTTTDMYLGEVQSTRRVKKLVLTGEEDWKKRTYGDAKYSYEYAPGFIVRTGLCSHYAGLSVQNIDKVDGIYLEQTAALIVTDLRFTTTTDFKAFLAAQYANGTPVTVWRALTTEETGIVNEPLRKIGDYVDSVLGTNLATSGAEQELDVDTTLKPSEVDMTYHGWHEHEDTKFTT